MQEQLDSFFALEEAIQSGFGYVEDWVKIPLEDSRKWYWHLEQNSDGSGEVTFSSTEANLRDYLDEEREANENDIYSYEIYTQRFLPKWVYETGAYTLICVDTHLDGNKYLSVFDNGKKV